MIGLKKFDYLQVWVQITCRSILVMLYFEDGTTVLF